MPNWCWNHITVEGPSADVQRFMAELKKTKRIGENVWDKGTEFYSMAEAFHPMPKVFEGIVSGFSKYTDEQGVEHDLRIWREVDGKHVPVPAEEQQQLMLDYGALSWYDWAHNNWGTKWGDCETVIQHDLPDEISVEEIGWVEIYCTSAWSPPEGILARVSQLFPTLDCVDHWDEESGERGEFGYKRGKLRWESHMVTKSFEDDQEE